ncbi:MAG: aldehyde dehydrogenase family protein, partial [Enterobacter hormaechei]|nr:aldehyde dehydrogenase family protein [Enterobacter hormaechei]
MTYSSATHAHSVNPATGETLAAYPWATSRDVERAIAQADTGFRQWRRESVAHRAQKLRDLGAALRSRAEEMAQTISREMGKPIVQARAEVAKSASLCDWYAEHGPSMLHPESTQVENAVIEYRPLGPILAVMPWNFPLWQVLRGAVPILLAGNSYLLKHAPNVLGSAELIGKVFADAGFPEGVFGWVNATNDGVSQAINDRRIAAVAGRYQNTGQVCAAAKRFIVEAGVADAFTQRFVDAVKALKMGAPDEEDNYIGPMARFDLRDELHQQVQATLAEGATLLLGGEKLAGSGNYYAPTVLGGVTRQMTAFRQELFGPVAAITVANDAAHALQLANDSDFGLSATVFTANDALAETFSRELECGGVFINGYSASDARVAFGGVKK